jgi:hypothetical protein
MEHEAPREPIPEKHQIGAVLAGAGWFIAFRRGLALVPSKPQSHDRAIFMVYALLASVCLAYAWGVLMAVVARHRGWTPRGCRLSGYPLWALGAFCSYLGLVGAGHIKAMAEAGGGVLAAELAGRLCRYLAFPELGWSGKEAEEPPLSINPGAPARPGALGSRPIG